MTLGARRRIIGQPVSASATDAAAAAAAVSTVERFVHLRLGRRRLSRQRRTNVADTRRRRLRPSVLPPARAQPARPASLGACPPRRSRIPLSEMTARRVDSSPCRLDPLFRHTRRRRLAFCVNFIDAVLFFSVSL